MYNYNHIIYIHYVCMHACINIFKLHVFLLNQMIFFNEMCTIVVKNVCLLLLFIKLYYNIKLLLIRLKKKM